MARNFPITVLSCALFVCLLSTSIRAVRNLRNHQFNEDAELLPNEDEFDFEGFEEAAEDELTGGSHPCQRPCEAGKHMTCKYTFSIEYFLTMSKGCNDCPRNVTDCYSKYCVTGDGVRRTILVVNRQMPGPAIDVCHGDTIEVDVINNMLDISTAIHWHGLLQMETPFMDGVPFVSQCLISPQGSFLYRFLADTPGTHLWHSHSALQRGDGIFGPIVIRVPPREDPHFHLYDYDLPEHVITILDWSHMLSSTKFITHYHSTGDNKPPSILVNGRGRFEQFRNGNDIIYTPAAKFTVESGKRYRFRVINAGFLNCPIEISVDNHNITVIASDGWSLKPTETSTLVTVAGERFDFVLEADQEINNYWMRFRGILDCKVKGAIQVGILHYEGADENDDPEGDVTYENSVRTGLKVNAVNTPSGQDGTLIMSELSSFINEEDDPIFKPEPDVKFYIPYDFYSVSNIHYHNPPVYGRNAALTPQINHISMLFPNFPVMANIAKTKALDYCNGSSISMECRFKFCECPHILEVPLNAVVEVILIDEGLPFDANHPFHLHGYAFRLLGMDRLGHSVTEEEIRNLDSLGLLKRNFENPPKKDTITVPDGGYAIFRFHANNPGFWILHCHLDFHVEQGMALLFKIGDFEDFVPPPQDFPTCGDKFRPPNVSPSSPNATRTYSARFFPVKTNKLEEGTLYTQGGLCFPFTSDASPLFSFPAALMVSLFFYHFLCYML